MQHSAQVGSRVMVQLGAKATAGYIVELIPRLRTGTSLIELELKDIQELLDVDPPLTPEVLEITRWLLITTRRRGAKSCARRSRPESTQPLSKLFRLPRTDDANSRIQLKRAV